MLEIDKLSYGSRWSQKKPEHKLVLYLVLLLMALLGTRLIQLGVLLLCGADMLFTACWMASLPALASGAAGFFIHRVAGRGALLFVAG